MCIRDRNQKGRVVVNQVEEKFCFQGEKTYCPAPFFWTDSGFGLYVDTCETTTFHFDENSVTIDLPESAPVVAFSGEPAQIVSAYMAVSYTHLHRPRAPSFKRQSVRAVTDKRIANPRSPTGVNTVNLTVACLVSL